MSAVPLSGEPSTFLADLDPNPLVVLGQDRRILYANAAARALSAPQNGERIEGLKLGDVLRCVHSGEPEGCGDTPSCLYCGANLAIRLGLGGTPSTEECRITASRGGGDNSLEYSIQSRPVEWKGEQAVFCALNDISHEKRRRVLERTFFHDILNTAGSVKGLSEILLLERQEMGSEELAELLKMMRDSCGLMLDEIRSQQLLLAAESGHLTTDWKQTSITDCIADATMLASHWPAAASKRIVPVYPAERTMFLSDPVLLGRVLLNLLKNALEATPDGGEVRLGCRLVGDRVEFFVWNAGAIPEAIRLQIFQRSFSTKGTGRGTGTYSVRLFAEIYLKGKVSFASNQRDGTTFTVSFPLEPPVQLPAGT
jgi:nitrogen-specific signal transduction histidine kinase